MNNYEKAKCMVDFAEDLVLYLDAGLKKLTRRVIVDNLILAYPEINVTDSVFNWVMFLLKSRDTINPPIKYKPYTLTEAAKNSVRYREYSELFGEFINSVRSSLF